MLVFQKIMKSFVSFSVIFGILEARSFPESYASSSSSSSSSYGFDYNYEYINETMYDAYLTWLYSTNYTTYGEEIGESRKKTVKDLLNSLHTTKSFPAE